MLITKAMNENAHLPYSLGSLEFALGHIYYLAFPFLYFIVIIQKYINIL